MAATPSNKRKMPMPCFGCMPTFYLPGAIYVSRLRRIFQVMSYSSYSEKEHNRRRSWNKLASRYVCSNQYPPAAENGFVSVAYFDCGAFAAELPAIHSIRRFARCAALMPYGYFIPEFGRLAADPPPPLKSVDWKTVAFSLPPMQPQQAECTVCR
jgi:hypothetical protein